MGQGSKQAAISAKITEESGTLMQTIIARMDAILGQIDGLVEQVSEINHGGEQISAITQEQSASMEEIATSSGDLTAIAERLQKLMNWFKINSEN